MFAAEVLVLGSCMFLSFLNYKPNSHFHVTHFFKITSLNHIIHWNIIHCFATIWKLDLRGLFFFSPKSKLDLFFSGFFCYLIKAGMMNSCPTHRVPKWDAERIKEILSWWCSDLRVMRLLSGEGNDACESKPGACNELVSKQKQPLYHNIHMQ